MAAIATNVTELIGNTPMVALGKLSRDLPGNVVAKLESRNPGGSVKDRIALAMIESAEVAGKLSPGDTMVEPTSGNTGIGLAMCAAAKGYRIVLTMPESMSMERRHVLAAFGAELVLTPREKGMKGAIEKANELAQENGWYMPQQFDNPANVEIHRRTTANEIIAACGEIGAFVAGVGTGGTVTGVGAVLKEHNPNVRVVAVEPEESPVLSGGSPSPHPIQGIGAGFVPSILDTSVYDEVIQVNASDSMENARQLTKTEGILSGVSCGAAVCAALRVAARPEMKEKTVVVVLPDTGERYLSTPLFAQAEQ